MEKFFVESLFDLSAFAHPQLFKEGQFAWDALTQIKTFFKNQILGKIECPVPEGVYLIHPEKISIGKGTIIEPGALIRGPCIIGEECEIRQGAYLRGHLIVGNRCILGHVSELKHSILLDDVFAAHFNYVGDSILGNRVNLGAGVKLANLRLDKENIEIMHQGQKISTHLKKFGAIVGDGAQFGCNAVANPGTIVGKNALCHPCTPVKGIIPSSAHVRSTQKMVIENYVDRSDF